MKLTLFLATVLFAVPLFAADAPTTAPASPWPALSKMLGLTGTERESVYTVTVPRKDLLVSTPDAGDIPTAAGLESTFHFFMCPCGKTNVVGTFILAEYESNDVIDALRDAQIHVVSVAPALYNESPRLVAVRFQGEAQADVIANAIKAALERTGDARNPKITLP
ncbi:MAG TPA: DUF1259 domain-containing protein [Tepidisphaeraceae bacterium]|jgi:hypothetical protein|nr:DUF1259 domain-containing protein [Tepidisphaeraceae bacterium]